MAPQLIDQVAEVFGKSGHNAHADSEALLAKIGALTVEKDFLSYATFARSST